MTGFEPLEATALPIALGYFIITVLVFYLPQLEVNIKRSFLNDEGE